MSDKIKILVVEPMQPCRTQEIPDTMEAMQALVGGDIEAVTSLRNASAIVCNDMGKFQGLPCNRPLLDESGLVPLDILHGTFFITGMNGEHFVSLTEEQIQRYKALYDNVMVVTAERPAAQAEIAPEATMLDFAVACQLTFQFVRDGQEVAESKDAFISHVTDVFNENAPLAERMVGGLDFDFRDGCAEVHYTFASQEKDKASAEVFSEQCVRDVQDRLEGFGCKVEKIKCFAEELEPDPVREPVKDHENQEKKKKGHCHDR